MDLNSDGLLDIVTGDRYGTVSYFRRKTDGTLTEEPDIVANGATIDVGNNSAPHVIDWNEDGLLDLVLGNETGNIRIYVNSGTPSQYQFTTYTLLQGGGTTIKYYRCCPHVADLDLDGRKDVLVGEDKGYVYFFKNTGTNASPVLAAAEKLKANGVAISWPSGQTDTRVWTDDWDGDGLPDLVLGNYAKYVHLYRNMPGALSPDVNGLSAGAGGTVSFSLDAGTAFAGRQYFLLGSASGTSPGVNLPGGGVLPLNWDGVFTYIRFNYNNAVLQNFRGLLDASGQAAATLSAGAAPLAVGTILHFAYTTELPYDFQSNAAGVEITP